MVTYTDTLQIENDLYKRPISIFYASVISARDLVNHHRYLHSMIYIRPKHQNSISTRHILNRQVLPMLFSPLFYNCTAQFLFSDLVYMSERLGFFFAYLGLFFLFGCLELRFLRLLEANLTSAFFTDKSRAPRFLQRIVTYLTFFFVGFLGGSCIFLLNV